MKITATFRRWPAAGALLAALLCAPAAWAAGTVDTLGGGPFSGNLSPAGYSDGSTKDVSQFNGPSGLALDSAGLYLFVADRTNNAVRKLDLNGDLTTTFAATNNVSAPVDLALDASNTVYVLNFAKGTNGFISKFNKSRNFLGRLAVTNVFTNAVAMVMDASTNLYVAERGGAIKRVGCVGNLTNATIVTIITNLTTSLATNYQAVQLQGIALTDTGNLIVTDSGNHALWRIALPSRTVTPFTGGNGMGDDFGDRDFAQFNQPARIARAGGGMFVVADRGNHKVKLVDASGTVVPLYGISSNLWYSVPGPDVYPGWWDASACEDQDCAEAREPVGVVMAPDGRIFTTEMYYHLVREVSGSGLPAPVTPPISPLFAGASGLASEPHNGSDTYVYVADTDNNAVRRIDVGTSVTTPFATTNLNRPVAVAVVAGQSIFVLNQGNGTNGNLVKFNAYGNLVATNATNLVQPVAMALDSATNLFIAEQGGRVWRVQPSGLVTNVATVLSSNVQLRGLAVLDDGRVIVSDAGNHALWQIHPISGVVSVYAGNHGPGTGLGAAPFVQFQSPQHLAKAAYGKLVAADMGNDRLVVVEDSTGVATLLDPSSSTGVTLFYGRSSDPISPGDPRFVEMSQPVGVVVSQLGDVFSSEQGGQVIRRIQGTDLVGPTPSFTSLFSGVAGVAVDPRGGMFYVADQSQNAVYRISESTLIFATTNLHSPVAVVCDPGDKIYVLNQGPGSNDGSIVKFNRYANLLPWSVTNLAQPTAMAMDSVTNLFVCELGGAVKRIDPSGVVATLGTVTQSGAELRGIVVMDDGTVVVSDSGNHALWQLHPISGEVSLFTGGNGPGVTIGYREYAQFNAPRQLARAGGDQVVVADYGNSRLLVVDRQGTVTDFIGVGGQVYYGRPSDPVLPAAAGWVSMSLPFGVTVSPSGEAIVSEAGNQIIRRFNPGLLPGPTTAVGPLFAGPMGLAVNNSGAYLFIADKTNNAVRRLDVSAGQTLTFATSNLNLPVAVLADANDNVYVLNQGNGTIVKFNRFANFLPWLASSFTQPTAMAMGSSTNLFVCELTGAIKRVDATGAVTTVATVTRPGAQLAGIAIMDDGMIAVSDSANHALWLVNPNNGTNGLLAGNNGAGSGFGTAPYVQFRNPQQIAKAGGDVLVVADQGNNRLMVVDRAGTATNLPSANSTVFYGRAGDPVVSGSTRYLVLALPLGVAVAPSGEVFDSEPAASVLRRFTGTGLSGPGRSTGGQTGTISLTAPVFTPNYGYFPMGQTISVGCENPVYYTTDGTEPTTSSPQVQLNGNTGTIPWSDSLRDLTSLRLKAISGTNASATIGGGMAPASEIGATRDALAGAGSTALIPIVLNLRSNDQVRTIIYNVEVTPLNGAPPVSGGFTAIDISSNDFLPMVQAFPPGTIGQNNPAPYPIHNPTNFAQMNPGGLTLSVVGTGSGFLAQRFASVAMLKIPIPATAPEGSAYAIAVTYVSATADGQQTVTPITPMPSRTLTVSNVSYTVGDSSPGGWYNAGDFGNGDLNSADVNNAFWASLGVRVPHTFSDVFDAMDTYPVDEAGYVGGDGQILFLDWQLVLQRSLRLDTNNFKRHWTAGGVRVSETTTLKTRSALKSPSSAPAARPGSVWVRQATLCAGTVGGALPGQVCSIPVSVKVAAGSSLAGLSFRAVLTPEGGTPPVAALSFTPAAGKPAPTHTGNPAPNELLCGWALLPSPAFQPALQGSNLLGYVSFTVPANAMSPQFYTLRFIRPDGAPNLTTPYVLDSIPGCAWVVTTPLRPAELVSDQWRTNFFRTLTNAAGDPFADADGDGVPNWQEYQAGTNPTNRQSRLEVTRAAWNKAPSGLALTWLTAPGKVYNLERCDHLGGTNWLPVASGVLGDGAEQSCLDTNASARALFYRLRLQP